MLIFRLSNITCCFGELVIRGHVLGIIHNLPVLLPIPVLPLVGGLVFTYMQNAKKWLQVPRLLRYSLVDFPT